MLQEWNGQERRITEGIRRDSPERRAPNERRFDRRYSALAPKRSLKSWVRSLSKARLGVDRRKGSERRFSDDRRSQVLQSLLTPEELADLLQE